MLGVMFPYICADAQTLASNNFNRLTISHTNKSVLPHIKLICSRIASCCLHHVRQHIKLSLYATRQYPPLRLIFIFLIHYKYIPPRCAVCKHWCLTDLKLMVPYSVRLPLCPSFRNGLIPCLVTATPCNLFFINLNNSCMLPMSWNIPPTYVSCV